MEMAGSGDTTVDVVVIGGGLAGCAAARDLKEAGVSVVLLEARHRLGGRTYYRKLDMADHSVELGGTWIQPRTYLNIMREVERYGLELGVSGVAPNPEWNTFYTKVGEDTLPGAFPIPADQWPDFEAAVQRIVLDARRIDPTKPLSEQGVDDLDITWEQYLDRYDLAPASRAYIDAFAALNAGADVGKHSALWQLAFLAGLDFSVLQYVGYVTKFVKGTKSLIDAFTEGIDVRLSSPVTSVQHDAEGVTVTYGDGQTLRARAAILATPVNTWPDVTFEPQLSDVKRELSAKGQPGHSFKAWALVEKTDVNPVLTSAYDPVVQMAFPEYEEDAGTLFACFGVQHDGYDVGDSQVIQDSLDRVGGDHPVKVLSVEYHDWIADPYSKGTWNCFPVGWLSKHQVEMQQREGRLAFAGSDVSIDMCGLLEGAVGSGIDAATDTISFLADN